LYSATAAHKLSASDEIKIKKNKKKLRGLGEGAVRQLPFHLQELLLLVALKKNTQVIKVSQDFAPEVNSSHVTTAATSDTTDTILPQTLQQFEFRFPTEEKDIIIYYFLLKVKISIFNQRCLIHILE
jgi:hypothetical protein